MKDNLRVHMDFEDVKLRKVPLRFVNLALKSPKQRRQAFAYHRAHHRVHTRIPPPVWEYEESGIRVLPSLTYSSDDTIFNMPSNSRSSESSEGALIPNISGKRSVRQPFYSNGLPIQHLKDNDIPTRGFTYSTRDEVNSMNFDRPRMASMESSLSSTSESMSRYSVTESALHSDESDVSTDSSTRSPYNLSNPLFSADHMGSFVTQPEKRRQKQSFQWAKASNNMYAHMAMNGLLSLGRHNGAMSDFMTPQMGVDFTIEATKSQPNIELQATSQGSVRDSMSSLQSSSLEPSDNTNFASSLFSSEFEYQQPDRMTSHMVPPYMSMTSHVMAEEQLIGLGFCGMNSLVPTRFLQDWRAKIERTRMQHVQQMQYMQYMQSMAYQQRAHVQRDAPEVPKVTQYNAASDFLHTLDLNSRTTAKERKGLLQRSASTVNCASLNGVFESTENNSTNSTQEANLEKQNSLDSLKHVLERQAKIFSRGRHKTQRRRLQERQSSLPLNLEILSEEEDNKIIHDSRSTQNSSQTGNFDTSRLNIGSVKHQVGNDRNYSENGIFQNRSNSKETHLSWTENKYKFEDGNSDTRKALSFVQEESLEKTLSPETSICDSPQFNEDSDGQFRPSSTFFSLGRSGSCNYNFRPKSKSFTAIRSSMLDKLRTKALEKRSSNFQLANRMNPDSLNSKTIDRSERGCINKSNSVDSDAVDIEEEPSFISSLSDVCTTVTNDVTRDEGVRFFTSHNNSDLERMASASNESSYLTAGESISDLSTDGTYDSIDTNFDGVNDNSASTHYEGVIVNDKLQSKNSTYQRESCSDDITECTMNNEDNHSKSKDTLGTGLSTMTTDKEIFIDTKFNDVDFQLESMGVTPQTANSNVHIDKQLKENELPIAIESALTGKTQNMEHMRRQSSTSLEVANIFHSPKHSESFSAQVMSGQDKPIIYVSEDGERDDCQIGSVFETTTLNSPRSGLNLAVPRLCVDLPVCGLNAPTNEAKDNELLPQRRRSDNELEYWDDFLRAPPPSAGALSGCPSPLSPITVIEVELDNQGDIFDSEISPLTKIGPSVVDSLQNLQTISESMNRTNPQSNTCHRVVNETTTGSRCCSATGFQFTTDFHSYGLSRSPEKTEFSMAYDVGSPKTKVEFWHRIVEADDGSLSPIIGFSDDSEQGQGHGNSAVANNPRDETSQVNFTSLSPLYSSQSEAPTSGQSYYFVKDMSVQCDFVHSVNSTITPIYTSVESMSVSCQTEPSDQVGLTYMRVSKAPLLSLNDGYAETVDGEITKSFPTAQHGVEGCTVGIQDFTASKLIGLHGALCAQCKTVLDRHFALNNTTQNRTVSGRDENIANNTVPNGASFQGNISHCNGEISESENKSESGKLEDVGTECPNDIQPTPYGFGFRGRSVNIAQMIEENLSANERREWALTRLSRERCSRVPGYVAHWPSDRSSTCRLFNSAHFAPGVTAPHRRSDESNSSQKKSMNAVRLCNTLGIIKDNVGTGIDDDNDIGDDQVFYDSPVLSREILSKRCKGFSNDSDNVDNLSTNDSAPLSTSPVQVWTPTRCDKVNNCFISDIECAARDANLDVTSERGETDPNSIVNDRYSWGDRILHEMTDHSRRWKMYFKQMDKARRLSRTSENLRDFERDSDYVIHDGSSQELDVKNQIHYPDIASSCIYSNGASNTYSEQDQRSQTSEVLRSVYQLGLQLDTNNRPHSTSLSPTENESDSFDFEGVISRIARIDSLIKAVTNSYDKTSECFDRVSTLLSGTEGRANEDRPTSNVHELTSETTDVTEIKRGQVSSDSVLDNGMHNNNHFDATDNYDDTPYRTIVQDKRFGNRDKKLSTGNSLFVSSYASSGDWSGSTESVRPSNVQHLVEAESVSREEKLEQMLSDLTQQIKLENQIEKDNNWKIRDTERKSKKREAFTKTPMNSIDEFVSKLQTVTDSIKSTELTLNRSDALKTLGFGQNKLKSLPKYGHNRKSAFSKTALNSLDLCTTIETEKPEDSKNISVIQNKVLPSTPVNIVNFNVISEKELSKVPVHSVDRSTMTQKSTPKAPATLADLSVISQSSHDNQSKHDTSLHGLETKSVFSKTPLDSLNLHAVSKLVHYGTENYNASKFENPAESEILNIPANSIDISFQKLTHAQKSVIKSLNQCTTTEQAKDSDSRNSMLRGHGGQKNRRYSIPLSVPHNTVDYFNPTFESISHDNTDLQTWLSSSPNDNIEVNESTRRVKLSSTFDVHALPSAIFDNHTSHDADDVISNAMNDDKAITPVQSDRPYSESSFHAGMHGNQNKHNKFGIDGDSKIIARRHSQESESPSLKSKLFFSSLSQPSVHYDYFDTVVDSSDFSNEISKNSSTV